MKALPRRRGFLGKFMHDYNKFRNMLRQILFNFIYHHNVDFVVDGFSALLTKDFPMMETMRNAGFMTEIYFESLGFRNGLERDYDGLV